MSYMALYRKWRPDRFQEVKGQEQIVTTLKNQIKHKRIGHAYLFCGTRGTGKTTIAKLMAKAVNCENPVDGSPCNECASCRAIAGGTSVNVVEIDAASNNGVDNIRQINNSVQYSPSEGRYLVYIIDEVHMLSIGAFNALLKTLEEPPEYVIFILATTESHKIPITILSRCQRYDFKRISNQVIQDRLSELLVREDIAATPEALAYISRAADGSMRDALSILDQCIAFNLGEELTYDRVLETIGAVDIEVYVRLFNAIIEKNVPSAMDILGQAVLEGKDLSQFVNEFTTFIRNVLMLKLDGQAVVELTSEDIRTLRELGASVDEGSLINYINILQEASNRLGYTSTKRIVAEVAIIKMCTPQMQSDSGALERRIEELEEKLARAPAERVVYVTESGGDALPEEKTALQGESGEEQSERIMSNLKNRYDDARLSELAMIAGLYDYFKANTIKPIRTFLDKARLVVGDTENTLNLFVDNIPENKLAINYFDRPENIKAIEDSMREMTQRSFNISYFKVSPKYSQEKKLDEWDLSKVKFEIKHQ